MILDSTISVGDKAPDFALPSTHGEIRLSSLLANRRVVLAFYTEDNTPTCSRELTTFKADYELFQELNAEVVAISSDNVTSHQRFCEKEGDFPFPLASDEELNVVKLYGVYDEESKRSRRAVFVIDCDGTVMHAIPYYNPVNLNQFQEVFTALGVA